MEEWTMAMKYNDHPISECAETAEKLIRKGALIFQKWTCEKCGDRVTGNTPNKFYTQGKHEDCGHITDITKSGCNYMVVQSAHNPEEMKQALKNIGVDP